MQVAACAREVAHRWAAPKPKKTRSNLWVEYQELPRPRPDVCRSATATAVEMYVGRSLQQQLLGMIVGGVDFIQPSDLDDIADRNQMFKASFLAAPMPHVRSWRSFHFGRALAVS
ncbi:MAG: hypothetical protein U0905_10990 [Pirellulales bacterium]